MKCGVYKIKNSINGKFYIGSSKDIDYRWNVEHRMSLNKNNHCNPKLQNAWNKYGESNFVLECIELFDDVNQLLTREQYYLDLLKPYERDIGYNICSTSYGGDTFTHNPNKELIREKLSVMFSGEKNPMFGENHSEKSILLQKEKSIGRYTENWFVEKYGIELGQLKFQERRLMLSNRIPIINNITKNFNFIGRKHSENLQNKRNITKKYFEENWNEFVNLVKSKKYTQRQLSKMLNISRPTLKSKMNIINKCK